MVYDADAQRVFHLHQFVARVKLPYLHVGVLDEETERIALCNLAERPALASDSVGDLLPFHLPLLCLLSFLEERSHPLLGRLVALHPRLRVRQFGGRQSLQFGLAGQEHLLVAVGPLLLVLDVRAPFVLQRRLRLGEVLRQPL